jgi:hypothetical protein
MDGALGILIFLVIWFVLMKFLLPRAGVPT